MRMISTPLVQLRLHHEYPPLGLSEVWPRIADIHQRSPRSAWRLRTCWGPLPCSRLSRPRTTTTPPPHSVGISRQQTFPPTSWLLIEEGAVGMVPTFTLEPFVELGAQLCPCGFATTTPQTFIVASRSATSTDPGVPRLRGYAPPPSPYPSASSWWDSLERLSYAGSLSLHLPVSLAGPRSSDSTDPSRLCQGCLPPFPSSQGSGCPQLQSTRCDGPMAVSFHHGTVQGASWRSMSQLQISRGRVARSSGGA